MASQPRTTTSTLFVMVGSNHSGPIFAQIVQKARNTFKSGRTRPIAFRERQLKQLLSMLKENTKEMIEAVAEDLRKVGFMA
jgi:aldehyde dehydrogenase (NAD+)